MSEPKIISYQPSDGLSYDPSEEKYWDEKALDKELERVFEICHGCRMCFKYCDAFPSLFDFIDKRHDGKVSDVTREEIRVVMQACFQCKLCEVQCPYTPREGHAFQLDFPRLVHRYRAIETRKHGQSLRDRLLGDPDRAGLAARASLGLANIMNRVKIHRVFMEKMLGIHRDKLLPEFAADTFESWADGQGLIRKEPGGEVVLFQTCYVQHVEPEIGKDTVEVLKLNGVDLRCVQDLVCCGMPAWESGNLEGLRQKARHNLDRLMPFVDAGAKVIAINPTCSMMMRREYPELLDTSDRDRARRLAAVVTDPAEHLWSLRHEPRFNTNFKSQPERVAYHAPCHLRAQAVGFRSRDLIRKTGVGDISAVMECCGHNGTYAMKVESFEASARIGQKAFSGMRSSGADAEGTTWVTDCPLAAVQFEQHAGHKPLHPMSLLARAYRGDVFPRAQGALDTNDAPLPREKA